MKKVYALVAVVALMVGLVGCGESTDTGTPVADPAADTNAPPAASTNQ